MKQSYFIMAHGVHMLPDAKLVIVGVFDVIKADQMPAAFQPFGVAIRLEADKSDHGRSYKGVLTLRKEATRTPLFTFPCTISFRRPEPRMPSGFVLTLGLPPLGFKSVGNYLFELRIGRKCVAQTTLYVRKEKKEGTRPATRKKSRKRTAGKKKAKKRSKQK